MRRDPAVTPDLPGVCDEADHFDGGSRGFKSLIAGLDTGAIQGLFERLAGEYSEAVRNAGFLLRLPDAARHFVVDGLVVGGLAAQQTTECNDGVQAMAGLFRIVLSSEVSERPRRGGDFPCAGHARDLNIVAPGTAAQERIERAFKQGVR